MNKQNVDYNNAYNGILILKRNEILLHAATWMNLENIMLSEIRLTRRQILYDSTSIMYLEETNS